MSNLPLGNEEIDEIDHGTPIKEEQSLSWLEDKYKDQMRQIFPTKIDLPWLTLKTQIEQQIDLRPDFQRRDRWTNEKRSRFIESVIMNVPVPPVFLGEEEYGKYVVLDGRQRLTAARMFLSNELRLEGLRVWKELNGLTYEDIKKKGFAATIERRFLPAVLLTKESSPEVKYEVFDRLNTGGVIAEPMEVRNAIFPGPFNDLLHELSSDVGFRKLWGIPVSDDPVALERNALYREMADLELVLRFFALRKETLNGMRFKDWLSEFMESQNAEYRKNKELEKMWLSYKHQHKNQGKQHPFKQEINKHPDALVFRQAIENCLRVFNEDAFKKPATGEGVSGRRSAPYADAVIHGLADIETSSLDEAACNRVRTSFLSLVKDNDNFRAAISTGTNGESAIRVRIRLAKEAVSTALNLVQYTPPAKDKRNTHRKR